MLRRRLFAALVLGVMIPLFGAVSSAQQVGSIRGVIYDRDFDTPIRGVRVQAVGFDAVAESTPQGDYVLEAVPAGIYTLVFRKQGYIEQVRPDVLVTPATLTDNVDVWLTGEFTEMQEYVVEDLLDLNQGTEMQLLELRDEDLAFTNSMGSELMSRSGFSDAAQAVNAIAGATVQDGKFAVVRGLPDRYVSSQLNGVRLPTADEDKRAVELDQFPAPVIESIEISKTFTPDQQGDASGGAVDVRTRGIPNDTLLEFKGQYSFNSQVAGGVGFLSYPGGGVDVLGNSGGNPIQTENLGENWDGPVGTTVTDAPKDHKWNLSIGGRRETGDDVTIGGFATLFYENDSSFYDNGIDDKYWVQLPGEPLTPQFGQGSPQDGEFNTALFDVTEGSQSVQWGGLAAVGLESENHQIDISFFYSRTAEDTATVATDTRGKEYYFPGYDPFDPDHPGNDVLNLRAAPYQRTDTIEYVERQTGSLQIGGAHLLPYEGFELGSWSFEQPEIDWIVADSFADALQPDKRQFGATWLPPSFDPGIPGLLPPSETDPTWIQFKPDATFTLGNLQRIFREIKEDSRQHQINLTWPFEQWDGHEGSLKFGIYGDRIDRTFDQESFSNFNDQTGLSFVPSLNFDQPWAAVFPLEDHPITASEDDVDYNGSIDITAYYAMIDLPLTESLNVITGARLERTDIGVTVIPEENASWYPPGEISSFELFPGDADVEFSNDDILPALGFVYRASDELTLRAAYSETVARQTFKELTPILQQEFLGAPIFIGNPDLRMSQVRNFDLRADFVPYDGGLYSVSWFHKDINDPIEYVQRIIDFTFTTPVNYPDGELTGFELEMRHDLGEYVEHLEGLSLGANATFIDAIVTLDPLEASFFELPSVDVPMTTRDMTNAPEHLYNLFALYDVESTGTRLGLSFTVKGDTLIAGAGTAEDNFIPSIYAKEFATLNFTLNQRLSDHWQFGFQAKNLTNPDITQVYRSDSLDGDVVRTSFSRGREFAFALTFVP